MGVPGGRRLAACLALTAERRLLLQMLATLAADPIAGLVDTAYIGRLGGQHSVHNLLSG